MENNQIKIKILYIRGVVINFIPAIFTWFLKSDILGGSENFLGGFYLCFFLLSFLFYTPYLFFKVKENQHNSKKRYLISFLPCLFYIIPILFFYYFFGELVLLLVFTPCIILNFMYALIVESLVAQQITPKNQKNRVEYLDKN
jgi:hypothetical protein